MERFNVNDVFYRKDNILIGPKTFVPEITQNCINIGDLILKSFMSNPNFIGQMDAETEEANTFQDMRVKSVKCALWMQNSGIQPNDVIMICTDNQLDAYIPFLAALYIGAVVSPLDYLFNLGLTETGIIAYQRQPGKMGSCGNVSANVQLMIVSTSSSNNGQSLDANKYGEIYCYSPYMLTAYKKAHHSHKKLGISDWFVTGDMGFYDEDGDIFIVERINQFFQVQNYTISPTVIENMLHYNLAVFETIVTYMSINYNKFAIAFVKKKPGIEVTEMEIKQFVIENLDYNIQLQHVLFLEYLPRFF